MLELNNIFYFIFSYFLDILDCMVEGSSFNLYINFELVGKLVVNGNFFWVGVVGGLVVNMEDIINWVRVLFVED